MMLTVRYAKQTRAPTCELLNYTAKKKKKKHDLNHQFSAQNAGTLTTKP